MVDVGELELFDEFPLLSQPIFSPSPNDFSLSLFEDPNLFEIDKSRGLLFSDIGVSLIELESRLLTCFWPLNLSRLLCASSPSQGDLRPISESMGRSLRGSLGPISIGVGLVTVKFSGENA